MSKLNKSQESLNEKLKITKKRKAELEEILKKAQSEQVNQEVIQKYEEELELNKQEEKNLGIDTKNKKEEIQKKKKTIREPQKGCADCRKNCSRHESLKIEHENDTKCCDKKKYEKDELNKKIKQLQQSTKPNSKKLEKLRAEFKELNNQSLKNRIKCPQFQAINQAIRECLECSKQKAKKAVKITPTSLQKVFLINKQVESEIYLLAGEAVC
jgi:chromosome segregation ATPase